MAHEVKTTRRKSQGRKRVRRDEERRERVEASMSESTSSSDVVCSGDGVGLEAVAVGVGGMGREGGEEDISARRKLTRDCETRWSARCARGRLLDDVHDGSECYTALAREKSVEGDEVNEKGRGEMRKCQGCWRWLAGSTTVS